MVGTGCSPGTAVPLVASVDLQTEGCGMRLGGAQVLVLWVELQTTWDRKRGGEWGDWAFLQLRVFRDLVAYGQGTVVVRSECGKWWGQLLGVMI